MAAPVGAAERCDPFSGVEIGFSSRLSPAANESTIRRRWVGGNHLVAETLSLQGGRVTEPSDAELMERVKGGDRDAFGVLVGRYEDPLVNYLCKLTHCRSRAEELAQDAFVRLFERRSQYRERGQLGGYLFRIALNLLRSQERRAQRWRVLSVAFAANGDGHPPSPQGELLSGEATEAVSSALAELPLRYRAPLVLREIEGWSYRDIAASLDCREGTVKSRINRGKERLRSLLEPYWNGGGP